MKLWTRFLDLLERWIVWPLLIGRFKDGQPDERDP
jgi:hypothetical protein